MDIFAKYPAAKAMFCRTYHNFSAAVSLLALRVGPPEPGR